MSVERTFLSAHKFRTNNAILLAVTKNELAARASFCVEVRIVQKG